ncbi:hypothetical protein NR798_00460 [Archangium gephyra]|uniref:hypothetical protein n=1 Tax=Archangium gephyra TaxID=48 RepID=UPI0035D4BA75
MSRWNEGIQVSGGSFSAGQVVVGRGSAGFQISRPAAEALHESGRDEVASRLEAFMRALEAHAAKLESLEEVVDAVQQVAAEAGKERPNRLTLKAMLESIKKVVDSVAEVAPAFAALSTSVMALVGVPR